MKRHFVTFYSPGTFVSETTEREIASWDTALACEMAKNIVERHGARPYGFRFSTRERGDNDLDSRVVETSGTYYLGGTILSLDDIRSRNDPGDRILISNMQNNGYDFVIENVNSYRITLPLSENDHVLDSI